jgi:hypothetical protein
LYINEVISCNDGWRVLTENQPEILAEIKDILNQITTSMLSRKPIAFRENVVTPMALHRAWDSLSKRKGWASKTITSNESFSFYIRSLKNRVSVRMNASDSTQFPNWLFVETQKSFDFDIVDLAILLVPMEDISRLYDSETKSGIVSVYRELLFPRIKVQLEELQPLRTIVPITIIGFSREPSKIRLYDIASEASMAVKNVIERSIEFKPEQYQAGMSILAYFGKVLEQKHPGIDVKVRIEQDKSFVRMHIETPDGLKSVIEKTLEDYSLVISDQAPPEILLDNKIQILELKNKLENATLEVKQAREFLQLTREMYSGRITSLEDDVKFLQRQLGLQLANVEGAHQIINAQARYHRDIVISQFEFASVTFDGLIKNYSSDIAISQALEFIKEKLEAGLSDADKTEIITAAEIIASRSPSLLQEVGEAAKATLYGVTGNMLYQWLLPIITKIG